MPSSTVQINSNLSSVNGIEWKPPPPNKLPPPPPPPPPPPKLNRTIQPPPPPPRNSSQLICQNNSQVGQICGNVGLPANVNGMLNSGSSMGSLNSAGRSIVSGSAPSQHCQRNLMKFNDNCSSRSSVSSHSSLQHHHHNNINHPLPNPSNSSSICHQSGGCSCASSSLQHNHINSSSMSDNGSCTYGQDPRNYCSSNCGGCCGSNNSHHSYNLPPKFQSVQSSGINMSSNPRANGSMTTTINRSALFHNNENSNQMNSSIHGNDRGHCHGSCGHHHHHHHALHDSQMTPNSNLPLIQPVDGLNNSFHRCHATQSNTISSLPSLMADQVQRPSVNNYCGHNHKTNVCNHHHQSSNFCDHYVHSMNQQQPSHQFNNCTHSHHGCVTPTIPSRGYNSPCINNRHFNQDLNHANRSSDASNNDSMLSTTHTHNLSNSSTTTHTSNVAVKHQPQSFIHPGISRGNRSSSSQHYDQYGQSSAASTSSATASISNYQTQAGPEDLIPLYPSKIHQPLPPPPARILHDTNDMMNFNNNNSNHMITNHVPVMTTTLINTSQGPQSLSHPLPPLPSKQNSPNASTCSTQITTLTTSSSLLNQPITRVTSQAGVQNPLPQSDTPPPLPPLNPSSRSQPLANSLMTRIQQQQISPPPMSNHPLINFDHNVNITGLGERKTENPPRHIEHDLERPDRNEEQHGSCFKCGEKVLPAQEACKAMDKTFHANCFVCCECNRTLVGKIFYSVNNKVYCEDDYENFGRMQPLEKCAACTQPIVGMILAAMGKSYHPQCFKCCVCSQCLDGVPFTIDMKDKIYCVKDYHNLYSPRCAACGKSIFPIDGTGETVRVVSMGKDYHIDCYCCEDCGLQLTDEEPSQSYPLDNHLLCQRCHINRLSKMQAALTLG